MNMKEHGQLRIFTTCLIPLTTLSGPVLGQSTERRVSPDSQEAMKAPAEKREAVAKKHVDAAVSVVHQIMGEPPMSELLQKAKGVLILPTYGRAALGVGASGGSGVFLAKTTSGAWSEPIFYNVGGINAGAQAGAEGGPIAMLLNSDKAVSRFMQKNTFTLSADAGLTVANWSKIAQGTAGVGDVTVWSGTKGLYGNVASIGINNIRFNQTLTDAYYHLNLSPRDVMDGRVKNAQAEALKQALANTSTGQASGTSAGSSEGSGKR